MIAVYKNKAFIDFTLTFRRIKAYKSFDLQATVIYVGLFSQYHLMMVDNVNTFWQSSRICTHILTGKAVNT